MSENKSENKLAQTKPVKLDLGAPQYTADDRYLYTVVENILAVDQVIKGMTDYKNVSISFLVDSLIYKILNEGKQKEFLSFKEEEIKRRASGKTGDDKNRAIIEANLATIGKCMAYFGKYFTFEERLAVIVA